MKRILIFAPKEEDRQNINAVVKSYFSNNFADENLSIQTYGAFNEPRESLQLGHQQEVFVIFDRRICPSEKRYKETPYYGAIKHTFELSQKICQDRGIPYILYKGEMVKNQEELFVTKMNGVTLQIKQRLEILTSNSF